MSHRLELVKQCLNVSDTDLVTKAHLEKLYLEGYQDRQLKRQQLIDTRREEIAAKIPKITELDAQIASLSVRRARQLLDGDASALTDLHDQIQTLSARKQECLQNAGYPATKQ